MVAKASPNAVPRAPAPKSKNSAEVVPKGVLSGLVAVCAWITPGDMTSRPAVNANPSAELRLIVLSPGEGRRPPRVPPPARGLLGKVHHGKATDPSSIAGLDVIEVHPAGDHLVIAIPHIPGFITAQGG